MTTEWTVKAWFPKTREDKLSHSVVATRNGNEGWAIAEDGSLWQWVHHHWMPVPDSEDGPSALTWVCMECGHTFTGPEHTCPTDE
jgi:hypothetical protein